ncbi:fork head transcription factor, partial [Basidiobolus meristosporus CBS 931.73]
DGKPPYSYAHLIAEAITSSLNKKMTLAGIYDYISTHYDYFRNSTIGWQNSIRHNLSLNKAFMKVPKGPNETGKGMFWQIAPGYE